MSTFIRWCKLNSPEMSIVCLTVLLTWLIQMKQTVMAELKERSLQPLPETVTKVVQLFETKNSRHSTMIVGVTLSGKTVTWRVLQATLSRLSKDAEAGFVAVKVYSASLLHVYQLLSLPRRWHREKCLTITEGTSILLDRNQADVKLHSIF